MTWASITSPLHISDPNNKRLELISKCFEWFFFLLITRIRMYVHLHVHNNAATSYPICIFVLERYSHVCMCSFCYFRKFTKLFSILKRIENSTTEINRTVSMYLLLLAGVLLILFVGSFVFFFSFCSIFKFLVCFFSSYFFIIIVIVDVAVEIVIIVIEDFLFSSLSRCCGSCCCCSLAVCVWVVVWWCFLFLKGRSPAICFSLTYLKII